MQRGFLVPHILNQKKFPFTSYLCHSTFFSSDVLKSRKNQFNVKKKTIWATTTLIDEIKIWENNKSVK